MNEKPIWCPPIPPIPTPIPQAPNPDAPGFGDLFCYADAEDATAEAIVKAPVAAYVEKVYEEANLSLLGIGT